MPLDENEEEIVELNIECRECDIAYSVFTKMDGFMEQARYCPFCGDYNVDYDRDDE
jgi:Zn finger protein HypA/HybF involved in hydrogenase expression